MTGRALGSCAVVVALLALGSPARATAPDAPCTSRPTADALEALAGEIVVLRLANHPDADALETTLREGLRCTREVLDPDTARRILRATRADDPLGPWPDAPGVSLLEAPGTLRVDGVVTTSRPTARPALMQITTEPPDVARWAGVLGPDADLPDFRVSRAGLVRGPRRRGLDSPSRRLFAGAVASTVLGVASLGIAARTRALYRQQPPGEPDPSLDRMNTASGIAGLALVGGGIGLGTGAVVVGRW